MATTFNIINHKTEIIKELNHTFNMKFNPYKLFIGYNELSEKLKYIITLPAEERKQQCNLIYILSVVLYRIYKGGNFVKNPFWDNEIVSNLEIAAELGSKHAWYDLGHFYKLKDEYAGHVIYALEKSLKNGFITAFKDLEILYDYHKKNNNHTYCNYIRHILNKYYTKIDKNL